jgi:RNA polymerase sigma-70 factor (ECF subfamily)
MREFETEDRDEFIPTRMTLIERLKQWDDRESWKTFFDTYWKLIYGVALRSGLSPDEAQEVVQETIISVSKNIGKFKADPAYGSFKSWLLQLTRWRITSQVRKRPKEELGRLHLNKGVPASEAATATEFQIPDPAANRLDGIWEEEWKKDLLAAALEKLKRRVSAKHYQIFYTHVIEGMPADKVARLLGASQATVYVVKLRLAPKLRKAVAEVEASRL